MSRSRSRSRSRSYSPSRPQSKENGDAKTEHKEVKRTNPPTSIKFFLIDQITCSLTFSEEFHLLFQMQKESRRYKGKKGD